MGDVINDLKTKVGFLSFHGSNDHVEGMYVLVDYFLIFLGGKNCEHHSETGGVVSS